MKKRNLRKFVCVARERYEREREIYERERQDRDQREREEHERRSRLRTPVNNIEYFPPNFEGLVLGCIDADFCK